MRCYKTMCLIVIGSLTASSTICAQEKSVEASFKVDSSYTVFLPSTVTIVPPTEYRVDGEVIGSSEGGESTVTAIMNTEPGNQVVVRIKENAFNESGNGIPLINESDSSISLTTEIGVRDLSLNEGKYDTVTRNDNIIATFSGKSGEENEVVTGGRMYFSTPIEKSTQKGGNYEAKITFEIKYEAK